MFTERHVHLENSAAELRKGGKDWYVGWQGIPMNNWLWENMNL